MVKLTQTIRWLLPMNCLSVFDHFVELAFKGLKWKGILMENWWKIKGKFDSTFKNFIFGTLIHELQQRIHNNRISK